MLIDGTNTRLFVGLFVLLGGCLEDSFYGESFGKGRTWEVWTDAASAPYVDEAVRYLNEQVGMRCFEPIHQVWPDPQEIPPYGVIAVHHRDCRAEVTGCVVWQTHNGARVWIAREDYEGTQGAAVVVHEIIHKMNNTKVHDAYGVFKPTVTDLPLALPRRRRELLRVSCETGFVAWGPEGHRSAE